MRLLGSLVLVAAAAFAFAAPPALAQGSGKFERAQPAAPTPGMPAAGDPLMRELMQKAQAGAKENGFCARVKWSNQPYSAAVAAKYGGLYPYSNGAICLVERQTPEVVENGFRLRTIAVWQCNVGAACKYVRERQCFLKASDETRMSGQTWGRFYEGAGGKTQNEQACAR